MLKRATAHPAHNAIIGMYGILGESGMLAYLTYMAQRLAACRKLLKPHGSIYLHCDPTASHYLKVVMDAVFGAENFRNEIVWCYTGPGSPKMRQFNRKHDTIFWYSNGPAWTFNGDAVRIEHADGGPHTGGFVSANVSAMDTQSAKEYGAKGKIPETWWAQKKGNGLCVVPRSPRENLGYPTQKPVKLLERIIKASSNEGDLVLDPFCGCGTTLASARTLNRKWIGIDISPFAAKLVRDKRLKDPSIPIYGIPTDMEGARLLLQRNPFDFEAWIVTSIDGLAANEIQVGDRGIDGRGRMYSVPDDETGMVLAQVKGGGYTASALRDFQHVMSREKATAGVFITLDKVTERQRMKAASEGTYKIGASSYPRLQFWSAAEHMQGVSPNLPTMADPFTGQAVQTEISLL